MDADTLQPLLLLERSTSAITDIKYTPQTAHRPTDCGHLMAAASRDLCIYVYDVTKGYQVPPLPPRGRARHERRCDPKERHPESGWFWRGEVR